MRTYEVLQERLRAEPAAWLVTGVAGFIGSNLLESLLKLDQKVVGLDNFAAGRRENLAEVEDAVGPGRWKNFRFIDGDIRSPGDCRLACRGVHYVLHQAALGSVPQSIEDPLSYHDTNVSGFLNMLVAARDAGVSRLVYASSSAAYGDDVAMPKVEVQIGAALSPYGLSKYMDELYAGIFARLYGFGSIGLRYFNVFGPRQDPKGAYAAVIPQWVASMIDDEPVYINGAGQTTRDFCHVDNVVQANLLAATVADAAAVNQVYNIALGEKTTLTELFEMIRQALEPRYPHLRDLRPIHRDSRPGDVELSQADIGKAARLLGYRPENRLGEGLAATAGWYAQAPLPLHAAGSGVSTRRYGAGAQPGTQSVTDSPG